MFKFLKNSKGQSLVELMVVIGLMSIFLPTLVNGFFAARGGRAQNDQRQYALNLLREAQETTRVYREKDWSAFSSLSTASTCSPSSPPCPYHPVISSGTWILSSGSETINGFTRSIIVSDVYRDSSGNISDPAAGGSTIDLSTKKVFSKVSWGTPVSAFVSATEYLTRYGNAATTQSGIAYPPGGGHGDWCTPNLLVAPTLDLPKNGVANALTAIEGRAFAGTGNNASGVSFQNITISNSNPPSAMPNGTFNGFKTNGIFGEANFAYLATDTNSKEIEIISLTGGAPSEAGFFDAPGNGTGNSVFVSGNIGYMTDGNVLYTFDLTSKSGSRPKLGNVTLAGTGNKVIVVGSYAYVAESGSTQLQIIQVSADGKTLSVAGQAQVSGSNGIDVSINLAATRAYLATTASSSQREMFVIDISTKTGSRPTIGSYEANGMSPKGIAVVPAPESIVLLVGTSGEEYQAIRIKDTNGVEITPARCGGANIDSGVNGVAAVLEQDGDAYSYIITGDSNSEFKLIEGGVGSFGSGDGTTESTTFDAGKIVAFNYFTGTTNANLSYKLAIKPGSGGTCSSVNFASSDFVAISNPGPIPLGATYGSNPGQCLRFRVINSSIPGSAGINYSVTINYSP